MIYSISNKSTLRAAQNISIFINGVKSFANSLLFAPIVILLIPILVILFLLYYPILYFGMVIVDKKTGKLINWITENKERLKFDEIKDANINSKELIETLPKLKETKNILYSPIKKKILQIESKLNSINKITNDLLYFNSSSISYTQEEMNMFNDLDEFWGDKEPYNIHTFNVLKDESKV